MKPPVAAIDTDDVAAVTVEVSPAEAHRLSMLAAASAVHASFRERELRRLASRRDSDEPPARPDSAVDRQ